MPRGRAIPPVPDRSLSRAERSEAIQRALLDAAVHVIGAHGYAEASIARITQQANVAQGTFYNYFASQQQLFEDLLPMIGREMIARVRDRRRDARTHVAKERAGLRAFFDYLLDVPEFYRLLNEAETFAPAAHRQHTRNIVTGYTRALSLAAADGVLRDFAPQEIEAVAFMLMGIRHYLAMRYGYGKDGVHRVPDWVDDTYLRLLTNGLFTRRAAARRAGPAVAAATPVAPIVLHCDVQTARAKVTLDADAPPDGVTASICRVAIAAAIAVADAAQGPGHVVATLTLSTLAPPQPGAIHAQASLQQAAGAFVVVQVQVTAESPLALIQITLQKG